MLLTCYTTQNSFGFESHIPYYVSWTHCSSQTLLSPDSVNQYTGHPHWVLYTFDKHANKN